MIDHITQMLAASKAGHFHVALVAALVLPDMCGALESTDGLATGTKYKAWVDQWVSPNTETQPEHHLVVKRATTIGVQFFIKVEHRTPNLNLIESHSLSQMAQSQCMTALSTMC